MKFEKTVKIDIEYAFPQHCSTSGSQIMRRFEKSDEVEKKLLTSDELFIFVNFVRTFWIEAFSRKRPAKRSLLRWPCSLTSDRAMPVPWHNFESIA